MNKILHFSKLNYLPHQRMRSNHSFSLHSHYKGIEKSFLADAMNMDAGTGSGDSVSYTHLTLPTILRV